MATVLHSWLNQAQENTRYDSVAAKYGLVVDTPSGMSQTGQNALRFLRSLSEHSPTFFEDQARLWSPPTPDLLVDLPVVSPTSPPHSTLATPISMAPARRPAQGTRTPQFDEALFALDMSPSDDPIFMPNHHHHPHRQQQRARPYPALPRIHPHPDLAPLGGTYYSPPPDASPLKPGFTYYPQPPTQNYPSPLHSPGLTPLQTQPQLVASPELEPEPSELEMQQLGGDADRARMSALMYGSMRARAVVTASETDGQGW
ncbi:unnamed protein product [Rhizoctonia solani]|uniref:Uncharacterized protein n=3 Tax=Rhizoctonia solani TaxID=456999 RepID=A0A8H3BGK8_9AGAM|nr:hypothetical protein RSOL_423550 [Rhizoctonia solani AG-3 Rhs1AP]KEP50857.1 hypothetical protein V565_072140 [Rhizoctonia solani 123E]CAE6423864.1 unnamed protein product [Rhizoctonia solani]CAE6455696.1 unnamed protein product [Rhizoctonia solani]